MPRAAVAILCVVPLLAQLDEQAEGYFGAWSNKLGLRFKDDCQEETGIYGAGEGARAAGRAPARPPLARTSTRRPHASPPHRHLTRPPLPAAASQSRGSSPGSSAAASSARERANRKRCAAREVCTSRVCR